MSSAGNIGRETDTNGGGRFAVVPNSILRAVSALQHGEAVAIEAADGSLHVAIHADAAGAEAISRLQRLLGGRPVLAIASAHARMLGLRVDAPSDETVILPGADRLAAHPIEVPIPPSPQSENPPRRDLMTMTAPPGSGEAVAVDLARLARLRPAVVVASVPQIAVSTADMAAQAGLLMVRARDVANGADMAWPLQRVADARVPLLHAEDTRIVAFRPADGGPEHMAIIVGTPDPGTPVMTLVLWKRSANELLSSLRCDHGNPIRSAIEKISQLGGGVLIYLSPGNHGFCQISHSFIQDKYTYNSEDIEFCVLDENGYSQLFRQIVEMLRQLGYTQARYTIEKPMGNPGSDGFSGEA